jgi:DNA repair protein RecN (Recombination protein N)
MLTELRVAGLGVVEDVRVFPGPGLCALTGETGAGKTLLIDAIVLLLGGTADPQSVRPGATEAVVEGRFCDAEKREVVLTRVVPVTGRSRAYVDGKMASVQQLAEIGRTLVDLHGQHADQSLLGAPTQRRYLDRFGQISTDELATARRAVRDLTAGLNALGGDSRSRARELDLLKHQLSEIESARIAGPDEDETLRQEEERLASAGQLREAAQAVWFGLSSDEGLLDALGRLTSALAGLEPLASLRDRLLEAQGALADIARAARHEAESIPDDPERLEQVRERRQVLAALRRKYGETLAEVLAFGGEVAERIGELEDHDRRAATLEARLAQATEALRGAEERLWARRQAAAPLLSAAVESKLHELALPAARFVVEVSPPQEPGGGGGSVTWALAANPGEPALPLTKVASGGELARTMLAARLAVWEASRGVEGPSTLVFDEVDAGIGGEAALAVGRALAELGAAHQVLVVTHLPQVAAFASSHLVARKHLRAGRAVTSVCAVEGDERLVELSRMLSGSPASHTARRHAEELLERARLDH